MMETQAGDKNVPLKDKIESILKDLRNIDDKATELVEALEKSSYSPKKYNLQFCQAYTIKLIQTYCKDSKDASGHMRESKDKVELMLASCGLLSGYEFKAKKQGERVSKYIEFVKENNYYNSLIQDTWKDAGSKATKVRGILNDIAKELANQIVASMPLDSNDLGFIKSVSKGNLVLPKPYILAEAESKSESCDFGRLFKLLRDVLNRKEFVAICMLIIVLLVAKLALPVEMRTDYPEQYGNGKNKLPVESITVTSPEMVILPGVPVLIPLEIEPDEAKNTFIFCNSSNPAVVYQTQYSATVQAADSIDAKAKTEPVEITLIPLDRVSEDVYDELNIIVDYTAQVDSPDPNPVTGAIEHP